VESLLRDGERHSTTFAEMHALSPDRLTQVLALRHQHESLVRSLLKQAHGARVLRADVDAKYLCLALLGMMNRVTVWYRPRRTFLAESSRAVVDGDILSGVLEVAPQLPG
jgi:Tetracyclin repressor-like, C-terminal domain